MINFIILNQLKTISEKINQQCDEMQNIDIDETPKRQKLEAKIGNLRNLAQSCDTMIEVGQFGEAAIKEAQQQVPLNILSSIANHVLHGKKAGSFTEALLQNDLRIAVGCADHRTYASLHSIIMMLWNDVPAKCWGSVEKVTDWRIRYKETGGDLLSESDRNHIIKKLKKHGYKPNKGGV